MKLNKAVVGVLLVAVFLFMSVSLFIVNQGEQALLLRLGRLVLDSKTQQARVYGPGLHFRWPFFEIIRDFDTRLQTLDIKSARIVTKEKKDVIVDYFVKWRIKNLSHYFRATSGSQLKAEILLEQQINTSLRAEFGKRTIADVVSGKRDDVMEVLRASAEKQAAELGIHVVDVRIKGIELPASTSNAIYQRMRANMQKIANAHRADGSAEGEAIQAEADARVTVILAEARSQGQRIVAEGQAKAAKIYTEAFDKNSQFFAFYRGLKVYEAGFTNKQDLLVLSSKDPFFDYLKVPVVAKK